MQVKPMVVFLLLFPAALWAEASRRIEIVAEVPPISQVESPGVVELMPGESRRVWIRVASNQAWLLSVQSDNPLIRCVGRQAGSAGGMGAPGPTCEVLLTCSADARGPQAARLSSQLITGPFVGGLPR